MCEYITFVRVYSLVLVLASSVKKMIALIRFFVSTRFFCSVRIITLFFRLWLLLRLLSLCYMDLVTWALFRLYC